MKSPNKRQANSQWNVWLGLILLVLVVYLGWQIVHDRVAAQQAALASEASAPPFFSYLIGKNSQPALVAFNPTFYDPRQPLDLSDAAMAELRKDLEALRPNFDGLVLYEYLPGLTQKILATAVALGYRAVLLGIWNPREDLEINGVAGLIAQFHDNLALAVVIGNEGLIDNRYSIDEVRQAAEKLRSLLPPGVEIPLTTSEPVGQYGLLPLLKFGDFLAPNIHPAVDQDRVEPVTAAEWVRKRALALSAAANKPVLVKETGVPNGGSPGFTPKLQFAFWEAYLHQGRLLQAKGQNWVSLAAAFEAYDLPWKAEKSGIAIESHWGLLNPRHEPYPAFESWRR